MTVLFGDRVAYFFKRVGMEKLANRVAKFFGWKDCGCGKRKGKLNAVHRKLLGWKPEKPALFSGGPKKHWQKWDGTISDDPIDYKRSVTAYGVIIYPDGTTEKMRPGLCDDPVLRAKGGCTRVGEMEVGEDGAVRVA